MDFIYVRRLLRGNSGEGSEDVYCSCYVTPHPCRILKRIRVTVDDDDKCLASTGFIILPQTCEMSLLVNGNYSWKQ